jgi:hypothetical protein
MTRWHAASVDQNFWPHRPFMRKWRPSSLIRFLMAARSLSRRHTASASNSLTGAGRKPPKMGGSNRVVSAGMDLLGTSKKMFFFLSTRRLQWSFTGDFPTAGFGGVATATLTPRATRLGKWPPNADAPHALRRVQIRMFDDQRVTTGRLRRLTQQPQLQVLEHELFARTGTRHRFACADACGRCSHPSCSLARGRRHRAFALAIHATSAAPTENIPLKNTDFSPSSDNYLPEKIGPIHGPARWGIFPGTICRKKSDFIF